MEVQSQLKEVYLANQGVDLEGDLQLRHQGLLVLCSEVASELIPHLDSEHLPLLSVPLRSAVSLEIPLMHKDNSQASELLRLLHSVHLLQPLTPIQEALGDPMHLWGILVLSLILYLEQALPRAIYLGL
jgi:hypothetical protein